jgi:hypothetical protein
MLAERAAGRRRGVLKKAMRAQRKFVGAEPFWR